MPASACALHLARPAPPWGLDTPAFQAAVASRRSQPVSQTGQGWEGDGWAWLRGQSLSTPLERKLILASGDYEPL